MSKPTGPPKHKPTIYFPPLTTLSDRPYNIKPEELEDLWQLMQYEWVYLYSDSVSLLVTTTSVVCIKMKLSFLRMISQK